MEDIKNDDTGYIRYKKVIKKTKKLYRTIPLSFPLINKIYSRKNRNIKIINSYRKKGNDIIKKRKIYLLNVIVLEKLKVLSLKYQNKILNYYSDIDIKIEVYGFLGNKKYYYGLIILNFLKKIIYLKYAKIRKKYEYNYFLNKLDGIDIID